MPSPQVELISLWLPILLTTVMLFFSGFICWMVLPNHKPDWKKLPNETEFLHKMAEWDIPKGNYAYPYAMDKESMEGENAKKAIEQGTFGTIQAWGGQPSMGNNLLCQVGFLFVTNFCLAYLATLGVAPGADFMTVFRFVATAAFLTFTAAVVPGAIWFKNRITGHIIDGVIQAAIAGAVFAWLWPSGPAG